MVTFKDIFRDEATEEDFYNLPAFEKEKVFNLLAEEDEVYRKLPELEKIKFRKILLTPRAEPETLPIADKETANVANDDDSGILGNTLDFGRWFYNLTKHTAIGAAKGIEEIGQTFRVLEDDAFNLPKPQTTAEGLAQGIGQFMPAFIPAAGAIG